jgi:cytosine/adenosine deaminase-related metal-dependent hydrolase
MGDGSLLVEGRALIGEELLLRPVAILVEGGVIQRIEEVARDNPGLPWICPALFNAHTHLGDTVAMDIPVHGSLDDLVRPPGGLKHRILAGTPADALVSGMRASIRTMSDAGTSGFADFREGGAGGVEALARAAEGLPCTPVIFGREGGEFSGHGLGVSSARDVAGLEAIVAAARRAGRMVAFHAGERDPADVDEALSYAPDLLVHATHATDVQLRCCADQDIPIAVCPRSNWRLGVTGSADRPPVKKMLAMGCRLLLGTDNVMLVQPDLWRELSFLSIVYRTDPRDALLSAVAGSTVFSSPFFIQEGYSANFLIIDPGRSNLRFTCDPVSTLVHRAGPENIVKKVFNCL